MSQSAEQENPESRAELMYDLFGSDNESQDDPGGPAAKRGRNSAHEARQDSDEDDLFRGVDAQPLGADDVASIDALIKEFESQEDDDPAEKSAKRTRHERDKWTYQVARASEAVALLCGETLGPNEITEETVECLHWLHDHPEHLDPHHRKLDKEVVTKDDLEEVKKERNQKLGEAYLRYMTCIESWTKQHARICLRACKLADPRGQGPMTPEEQQLCLFLIEQKLKAHMVLRNTTELSIDLQTLAYFSSCMKKRSDRCMSSEFVLKHKLDDNIKTAKKLMIHCGNSLLKQEQYELACLAFHLAGDFEQLQKCWKQDKERAIERAATDKCSICYTNPVQLVFHPCAHGTSCKECFDKMKSLKCPICRETIQSTTAFVLQAASSN